MAIDGGHNIAYGINSFIAGAQSTIGDDAGFVKFTLAAGKFNPSITGCLPAAIKI